MDKTLTSQSYDVTPAGRHYRRNRRHLRRPSTHEVTLGCVDRPVSVLPPSDVVPRYRLTGSTPANVNETTATSQQQQIVAVRQQVRQSPSAQLMSATGTAGTTVPELVTTRSGRVVKTVDILNLQLM